LVKIEPYLRLLWKGEAEVGCSVAHRQKQKGREVIKMETRENK